MKRLLMAVVTMLLLCLASVAQTARPSTPRVPHSQQPKQAPMLNWKAIQQSALVIDTHADTPGRFVDENFDPGNDADGGHWDLAKAREANLGAEFFSIWVDPEEFKGHYAHRALDMIDAVYETVRRHPDQMVMAYSSKDILAARRGPHKRIAILIGLEGGHAIEGDTRLLRDYYRLGVRYMTLTWANSNELGQSSGDYKTREDGKWIDPGLTDYGRDVVREMNRLGMMVDVSHVSDRSFYNALTVSRAPVIASHSSSRAITDVPRNLTDDMLVALARNGGVAQVNFNCGFISSEYNQQAKNFERDHADEMKHYRELFMQYERTHTPEAKAELEKMRETYQESVPRPPLSELIDHIDHMVKVAGIDHVGIGSDFDGVPCLPQGIDSVGDLPKITQELVKRGYSTIDIQKILGGNMLRVFQEVEKTAYQIQHEKNPDTREVVPIPPEKL